MPLAIEKLSRLISPPPRLSISQWADKFAYLPKAGNASSGKYRGTFLPWQKKMLDDPLNPNTSQAVWCMASQAAGKTLCLIIVIEYFIAQKPTGIQVVYPTLDSGKKWMRKKFMRTVRETPCMDGIIKEPRTRDSESTTLDRMFPGGDLTVIGANSATAFRQESKEIVIEDELDNYEMTEEGDPEDLAERASITFSNSFTLRASTPTLVGTSRIWNAFHGNSDIGIPASDKQYFHLPCCKCGHMQHLKWSQFKFSFEPEEYERALKLFPNLKDQRTEENKDSEIRDTQRAVYVCENPECGHWWTDQDRIRAIQSGHDNFPPVCGKRADWIATAPFQGITGRHLNGMYLMMGKKREFTSYFHQFAERFLKAKSGGKEKLMVWMNTFLTEPFAETVKETDWNVIAQRAEPFGPRLPAEVMVLTASVDINEAGGGFVQIEVLGWGDEEETWGVCNYRIAGNFDSPAVQDAVEDFLSQEWIHESGGKMKIHAVGFDTGRKTETVYKFIRKRGGKHYVALKGGASTVGTMLVTSRWHKHQGIWLHSVADDTGKTTVYERLEIAEAGARYQHFPKAENKFLLGDGTLLSSGYTTQYFRQLCSEKLKTTLERGKVKREWIKVALRNEALDLRKYNFAVFTLLPPGLVRRLKKKLAAETAEEKAEPPSPEAPAPVEPVQPRKPKVKESRVVGGLGRFGGRF